jgi:RimJ/RimL family protein N-acetyltransferase
VEPLLHAGPGGSWFTERLRLEPVGPGNAADLWLVHKDDEVSRWYDGARPSLRQARQWAKSMGESWQLHGVHKWIAHDREAGQVVGRGGLSRTPVDDDWGQLYALLPPEPWVRVAHEVHRPFRAHADWLEIGWALRPEFWRRGHSYRRRSGSSPYSRPTSADGTSYRHLWRMSRFPTGRFEFKLQVHSCIGTPS